MSAERHLVLLSRICIELIVNKEKAKAYLERKGLDVLFVLNYWLNRNMLAIKYKNEKNSTHWKGVADQNKHSSDIHVKLINDKKR